MTKEELIKELELLADSCDSNYALELNGYNRGVLDALSVVNKYFALAPVSRQVCTIGGECKSRGENNECKGTAYCGYKKHTFC